MLSLWRRLPVVVRAVLAGIAVAAAGLLPWVLFAEANQKVLLRVPWAILPTALYLWLFWRYLKGAGWPRSTSEARRTSLGYRSGRASGTGRHPVWPSLHRCEREGLRRARNPVPSDASGGWCWSGPALADSVGAAPDLG